MKIANWLRRFVGVPPKELPTTCDDESTHQWYYSCPKCGHKHGEKEKHAIFVMPAGETPIDFKLACVACGHISVWADTGIAGHFPLPEDHAYHKQFVYGNDNEEHF